MQGLLHVAAALARLNALHASSMQAAPDAGSCGLKAQQLGQAAKIKKSHVCPASMTGMHIARTPTGGGLTGAPTADSVASHTRIVECDGLHNKWQDGYRSCPSSLQPVDPCRPTLTEGAAEGAWERLVGSSGEGASAGSELLRGGP